MATPVFLAADQPVFNMIRPLARLVPAANIAGTCATRPIFHASVWRRPVLLPDGILALACLLALLILGPRTNSRVLTELFFLLCRTRILCAHAAQCSVRRAASSSAAATTPGGHPTAEALKSAKTEAAIKDLKLHHAFHKSAIFLAVAAPVAFVLSPSKLNIVVDLALAGAIPFHSYVGMCAVVDDYIPRGSADLFKSAAMIVAGLTAAGMVKSTLFDAGPTETLKTLWRPTPKPEAHA